ncbi:helix-turn-helix transcriptional regulator [Rhodococcus opacus]|nr:helix-turn-helix transcriptional regulator [Rhodococcus opacus]
MRRTRQSMWLSRLTAEQRHGSTTVQKVITPLGFAEGTTQCLYSTEGHYVGVLNIGTRSPASTLGPARHALTLLFDALAAALTTHTPDLGTPPGPSQGWEATIADDPNFCTVTAIEAPSCVTTAAAFPLAQITRDAVRTRRLPTTLIVPFRAQCIEVHLRRIPGGVHASCRVVDFDGPLSHRELQVLAELTRGHTNQAIAQILTITPRTVATHIEHILSKLGVPNRAAAAAYGARLGLDLAPPQPRP